VIFVGFELLKKRALSFLRDARSDFEHGDYPKTHSIIRLLKDVAKVYDDRSIDDFVSRNLEALYLLEEAYISSRYLPREYDQDIATRILKIGEDILGVFKCLELH